VGCRRHAVYTSTVGGSTVVAPITDTKSVYVDDIRHERHQVDWHLDLSGAAGPSGPPARRPWRGRDDRAARAGRDAPVRLRSPQARRPRLEGDLPQLGFQLIGVEELEYTEGVWSPHNVWQLDLLKS